MLVWPPVYSAADAPSRWRIAVAKNRRLSALNGMSESRRSLRALPVCAVSRAAISGVRSSMRSASLFRIATRCGIHMSFQRPSANDARAAATARSTSAAVPAGTRPTTAPVAGLRTSIHSPLTDSVARPSIHIL